MCTTDPPLPTLAQSQVQKVYTHIPLLTTHSRPKIQQNRNRAHTTRFPSPPPHYIYDIRQIRHECVLGCPIEGCGVSIAALPRTLHRLLLLPLARGVHSHRQLGLPPNTRLATGKRGMNECEEVGNVEEIWREYGGDVGGKIGGKLGEMNMMKAWLAI